MNWHQTIKFIRTLPEYADLVEKAYLEENLPLNVERFRKSEEFLETLLYIKKYMPNANYILDIGSGNGASAVSFALDGYKVVAVEPDPSETIGAGAVRKLKEYYALENIEIKESFAEDLYFDDSSFDIVYARQSMHHAKDLAKFVKESTKGLKSGGMFISVRDHVLYNHKKDENWFLKTHPLQKFYGGEGAYTEDEYKEAIKNAGLTIYEVLKHYDSVINYFPMTRTEFIQNKINCGENIKEKVIKKLHIFGQINFLQLLFIKYMKKTVFDESKIPGRMYSFIAIKK
jgi:SAM-dependent methyltransferase